MSFFGAVVEPPIDDSTSSSVSVKHIVSSSGDTVGSGDSCVEGLGKGVGAGEASEWAAATTCSASETLVPRGASPQPQHHFVVRMLLFFNPSFLPLMLALEVENQQVNTMLKISIWGFPNQIVSEDVAWISIRVYNCNLSFNLAYNSAKIGFNFICVEY